jgi:hypothetical protein
MDPAICRRGPANEEAAAMGKDIGNKDIMSSKDQENIGKGLKQKKNTVARASNRTIKKLLKTEKMPASKG